MRESQIKWDELEPLTEECSPILDSPVFYGRYVAQTYLLPDGYEVPFDTSGEDFVEGMPRAGGREIHRIERIDLTNKKI